MAVFSAFYWAYMALASIPFYLGALVIFALTAPFDRRRVILHQYSSFWAACYLRANPTWRARIEGSERLPWRGPAVIVANHASLIDILVLFSLFRPFKWVSKRAVFSVPFLGWNMWLNDYVPLVRGDPVSIGKMMDHCVRHLRNGSAVLLFPEGTRSADGKLKTFRDGAFRLAKQENCPVIPIAIHGTATVLPKNGLVLREPMNARVQVLDAIDPAAFDSPESLRDFTRSRIEEALARLPTTEASAERQLGGQQ